MTRCEGCDRRTCETWMCGEALDVAGSQRTILVDGGREMEAVLRVYGMLVFLSHRFKGQQDRRDSCVGGGGRGFWFRPGISIRSR